MALLPKALEDLIDALTTLPGVGRRSAERYAYYLLRRDSSRTDAIANALQNLHKNVTYCPITFALISKSEELSSLYTDTRRDKSIVAIVEDAFDVVALENTGHFKGTYHVLGGLISPIDGIGPDSLHIDQLLLRIKKDNVTEVILATSASVEGESTALYLQKQLENTSVKLTRLAQGLPIGLDLEYADQITLGKALEGRRLL